MATAKAKRKKKTPKSVMVSIRLEQSVVDFLDETAEKEGRTRTNLVTQILRQYLES